MDSGSVLTDRSALFALGMAGLYGAWVLLSPPRPRIKVIVYHNPGDAYFEAFRRGVVQQCSESGVALEYVALAGDPTYLEHAMLDHIDKGEADGFVCRIPSESVQRALVDRRVPFVSVMGLLSDNVASPLCVDRIGVDSLYLGPRDRVVVDTQIMGAPPNVQSVTPDNVLDVLSQMQSHVDKVILIGPTVTNDHIVAYARMMNFKKVEAIPLDGFSNGKRSITSVLRHRTW